MTRICIASIRYYYPSVKIFIIKDYLNGYFNSEELEQAFNISVLELGIKNYGWAVSKMHVLLAKDLKFKRILLLDSDIVFVGRFLEKLLDEGKNFDLSIDVQFISDPNTKWVNETYYDINFLKKFNPDFQFPGYVFNTGQMVITPGLLLETEISEFFDLARFPYWKNRKYLPAVDQSLLNYIIPYKEQREEIKIHKTSFMIWSESEAAKNLSLDSVRKGNDYEFLIHWAGALRVPSLNRMTRGDILKFFENYYYAEISFKSLKREYRKISFMINSYKNRAIKKLFKAQDEKNN